jgi:hypothetical protein
MRHVESVVTTQAAGDYGSWELLLDAAYNRSGKFLAFSVAPFPGTPAGRSEPISSLLDQALPVRSI